MRDAHFVSGTKKYYDDLEVAIQDVKKVYPTATREGSVGCWSWQVDGDFVAEAWVHHTKPGWWVRIKKLGTKPKPRQNA